MADDRGTVRQIAWLDLFPCLSLVRAVRVAASPRLIFLAAIGLVVTVVGWWLIGWAFSGSQELQRLGWADQLPVWTYDWRASVAPAPRLYNYEFLDPHTSPIVDCGRWFCTPFVRLFDHGIGLTPWVYSLVCGLWLLAVWALIGGAITRIAALALARETRLSLVGGLRFAVGKWPAYFCAALVPMTAVALLGALGVIYGLLTRNDVVAVVMSLLWPVLLLVAFGVAVLLLGLLFGWPLMWTTVSTEGTDSFDALSRSYSYTFQRPLHYLFYVLVAGFLGLLAMFVASLLAVWTQQLPFWAISWGAGHDRTADLLSAATTPGSKEGTLGAAAAILSFWNRFVSLLAAGYLFSYFWTAITRIYFLLRLQVDGTEMDEIAFDEQAESEQSYGLPPLATDESGVPRVVDPPPPQPPPASGGADKAADPPP